jgi:signal transduction histidine kinase
VKHSGAQRISLFSEVHDGQAFIHIRDDGAGIEDADLNRVTSRLNQRVESVGGLVDVDSEGPGGTEVKITVGAV